MIHYSYARGNHSQRLQPLIALVALEDAMIVRSFAEHLRDLECECICVHQGGRGLAEFERGIDQFDGVVVNLAGLPIDSESVVSRWVRRLPVAGWVNADDNNIDRVVRIIKAGAFDVFHGEFSRCNAQAIVNELSNRVGGTPNDAEPAPRRQTPHQVRATHDREIEQSHQALRGFLRGSSPAMEAVRQQVAEVARTQATVMIWGESGTGKELVANAIHQYSVRCDGPFLPVNMSAIPEGLAESMLFGHMKGSFTSATQNQEGLCELADGGTLFLDEIGEMEMSLQPKLLRFLQEGTIRRVGAQTETRVNVRIIAATNRDPSTVVHEGQLRQDLFFRLNVVPIYLPPLRERKDDIQDLAQLFLERAVAKHGRTVVGFTDDAMQVLKAFDWPGNVRQLENVIERIAIFAKGDLVKPMDVPAEYHIPSSPSVHYLATAIPRNGHGGTANGSSANGFSTNGSGYGHPRIQEPQLTAIQRGERAAIIDALQRTNGHVIDAANLVGLGQATLYRKIKQYNIPHDWHRRRKKPK